MKRLGDLTDQQLAIVTVLWRRGEVTANEVHQALETDVRLARGTVGTMLHRLERQGIVGHRAAGREFLYRARVTREDVMAARLEGLVGGLFDGDLAAMVSFAVSKSEMGKDDVGKLKAMLAAHDRRRSNR